jgi:hypothetical protein
MECALPFLGLDNSEKPIAVAGRDSLGASRPLEDEAKRAEEPVKNLRLVRSRRGGSSLQRIGSGRETGHFPRA